MNTYIGIGKINDISVNGKVLKFNFAVQQEKPCSVPCVLFHPDDEAKKFVEQMQTQRKVVWLQGRISMYEYEYQGKTITKIQVITYPSGLKPI
jgi:hypothetical protein